MDRDHFAAKIGKLGFHKSIVKPNEKGKIIITYNTNKKNDWNFLVDYLNLSINGKKDPKYRITVTATIEEDYTNLTQKQLDVAPKIKVDKKTIDFGMVKTGKKLEFIYKFKNEGKSDLILRKIECSCPCTIVTTSDKSLKAGRIGKLKISFDTQGQSGKQNKAITITTNDPTSRRVIIYLNGNVN